MLTRKAKRHLLALMVVIVGLSALDAAGSFRAVENAFISLRMKTAPHQASGELVFAAIDARSLRRFGFWPWSRRVHAQILEKLIEAGAREVVIDIDLSVPSAPEADAALAEAIDKAGGAVVLPVFQQREGPGDLSLSRNLPLWEFRRNAWLAAANLQPERSGLIRRYPYGEVIDGEPIPSIAAVLSGVFGPLDGGFLINFSISPATIPSVSVIDIIEGNVDTDLARKSVVVGAYATELADSFAVPVHGVLPGALIEILAAETLAQGLELRPINRSLAIGIVSAIALTIAALVRPVSVVVMACGCAVAALEALAFWAQARHAVILPTPVMEAVLVATPIVVAAHELDLHRWLLQLTRVEMTDIVRILERVIADSTDAVLIVDDQLEIVRSSRSARRLFAIPERADHQLTLDEVVPPEMAEAVRAAARAAAAGEAELTVSHELAFDKDGRTRHIEFAATPSRLRRVADESGRIEERVVVSLTARDVTEDREQRARMDRLARFDVLTSAVNRSEFLNRLAGHLGRGTERCAVLAFNLHRLQTINATLGRRVGDALLVALVKRIDEAQLGLSRVARLGGDRFAAHTLAPATEEEAHAIAERLLRRISAPFRIDCHSIRVGVRVGVATAAPGDDAELLLGKAELALDEARRRTGPGVRVFDQTAFARQERARRIERAHWDALAEGQMSLAYQPQVRLSDGQLVGAEALMRWRHPEIGQISPTEFIEIAEGSGFIEHLGRWALEAACLDAVQWPKDLTLSVNVSLAQFHRSDVVADVERALAVTNLPARRLYLEITESVFLDDSIDLAATLESLRALGVRLALDDFGSGFSSFGYLGRLPLDKLKVDQIFVQGLDLDPWNEAVIRSMVLLSRELDLRLLCEGVETAAQSEALKALGCDEAQGYFYGRPETAGAFLEQLAPRAEDGRLTG